MFSIVCFRSHIHTVKIIKSSLTGEMGVQYVRRDLQRKCGGHRKSGTPRPPDQQHRPGSLQERQQILLQWKFKGE